MTQRRWIGQAACFCLLSWWVLVQSSIARADQVVYLPTKGEGSTADLEGIDAALERTLGELGHQSAKSETREFPTTSAERDALAGRYQAQWIVEGYVGRSDDKRYRLRLQASYTPADRIEEIEVDVERKQESARLKEVLAAMLRPEGLGDEALRLSQESTKSKEGKAEERAEGQKDAAPDASERALSAHHWITAIRGSGHGILTRDTQNNGESALGGSCLQLQYAPPPLPRLRLGLSFGFFGGATTALGYSANVAYLIGELGSSSRWHWGVTADLGVFQGLSGSRNVAFMARTGPLLVWSPNDRFEIQIVPPELLVLSSGGGVLALGGSLGLGWRF